MSGKPHQWHEGWCRATPDVLAHISGLRVNITRGEGFTDLVIDKSTLNEYQAYELAHGVPMHELVERLKGVLVEAIKWHQNNP